jgi:hypothetical protein
VDAKQKFYQSLKGISDPEGKRKAIGKTFIEVFEEEAGRLKTLIGSDRERFIPMSSSRQEVQACSRHQIAPQRRWTSRENEP